MSNIKSYAIHEKVGSGFFGDVFRATSPPPLSAEVAIKQIHTKHIHEPEFIRRFESEATIVARLQGSFITPVIDYWRDADGAYIVMWYMKGGSLKDAIKDGPFDITTAARLIDQICIALAKAHRHGIIHRDVKPANILFDEDGNAFLSDFNIAKNLGQAGGQTEADEVVGTFGYSAPEQIRGDTVFPSTDVYSLGVVLYEMLKGEHPFPNLNKVEVIFKSINDPVPLLDHLDDRILDDVNQVIQTATAKDPLKRYSSADDFSSAFRKAIAPLANVGEQDQMVMALTRREQEVVKLIIDGKSNRQIANDLFLALSTVKGYINNIYKKLNVRNRVELVVKVRDLKLIVDDIPPQDGDGYAHDTYIYLEAPDNPYKGLDAFTLADEGDFFGREAIRDKLLNRMQEDGPYSRFLAIVGPSGSGKSSLVKAGIMPAIYREALPGLTNWYMVDFIPGNRPLDKLEVALQKVASDESSVIPDHLRRDEYGLVRVADLIMPDDDGDLLIIIDQFEEVFTLLEDEDARQHFLNLIYHAATEPRSRVRILVTLRADFWDRPLHYPGISELMRERMETVLPLSAEELEQAIVKPAEKVHVRFEEGLVARIISDINYQPGALPLLQFALTQLFEEREKRTITNEAYQRVGGAVGALAQRADELFLLLPEEGQIAARQMFLRLVTLGEGTEDTRRRVTRDELLSITDDPYLMEDVIDFFAADRLLALDHDPATRLPTVEVAHEAILREWEMLRTWLNDSRDDIKMQRRLSQNAEAWTNNNHDDSYLVSGTRLEQFERWSQETSLSLSPVEAQFLDASIAESKRREAKEKAQVEREANLQLRARRVLQGLVAVFIVATIISAGLALFAMNSEAQAQENERQARREAEVSHSVALASSSQEALSNGDHDLAVILALEANAIDNPPPEARRALSRAVYAPGTRRVLEGHQGPVVAVDFSPDGRYAVSAGGKKWVQEIVMENHELAYYPEDFSIRLWDLETGNEVRRLDDGHTDAIWDVAYSPDGQTILSVSSDTTVIVWDAETGKLKHRMEGHEKQVRAVAYLPDSKRAMSVSTESFILWDLESGESIHKFYKDRVRFNPWDIDITSDGRFALIGMRDGTEARTSQGAAILLDVETGEWVRQFDTSGPVYAVAISPDDNTILLGAHELVELTFGRGTARPIIMHIDIETGEELARYFQTGSFVTGIKFSPDGKFAIASSIAQSLYVWDLESRENVLRMAGHEDFIIGMALSPDGSQVLTASQDATVRLWDLRYGLEVNRILVSDGRIGAFDMSPDGKYVAATYNFRRLLVWELVTGELVHDLGHTNLAIGSLAFSPDSQQVAYTSGPVLTIKDIESNQEISSFILGVEPRGIEYTPDGKFLFIGYGPEPKGRVPKLVLIDVSSGEVIREFFGHQTSADAATVSLDGRFGYSVSLDATMRIWDLNSKEQTRLFASNRGNLWQVSVSPDGRRALTTSEHLEPILWNLETGEKLRFFEGHSRFPFSSDISPDGTWAVSASAAREIFLWDLESGQAIQEISGIDSDVFRIRFLPDGKRAVSAGKDGNVILWRLDINPDETIAWAFENRYIREFSCLERERYTITPFCRQDGTLPPSNTPFPTLTASPIPSMTPDSIEPTGTPDWTPIPSYTPELSNTPAEKTLLEMGLMQFSGTAFGSVRPDQLHEWTLEVSGPVTVSLERVGIPAVHVTLISPSGKIVVSSEETTIGPVELSETGTYVVQVQSLPEALSSSSYFITPRN